MNLRGRRYGRLKVLRRAEDRGSQGRWWQCRCDCGEERAVRADHLTRGITVSCGCRRRSVNLRHGHVRGGPSRTYRTWRTMLDRCRNPNVPSYRYYGAKGIRVCRRWEVFENFLADMGERPPLHSLDRRNARLGYSPANCRWATREEQASNTSRSRRIRWKGEALTISQWARRLGVQKGALSGRLNAGWSVAEALGTPVGSRGYRRRAA